MSLNLLIAEGTFRDPAGRLYRDGDRILREVYPQHAASVLAWLRSPLAQRWIQQGRMVPTTIVASEPGRPVLLEHDRVFFPTYPWEWAPSQWKEAASLTLDLCEEALGDGFVLKDATPLNILFAGHRTIFVDVLSFERRDPQCPLWIAYAQFVRTFLLPLCAYLYLGWPLAATQQRRDGYEPADLAPFLSLVLRWRRPLLFLVTLPLFFQKRWKFTNAPAKASADTASFAMLRLLRSTRRTLNSLVPSARVSRWSRYPETANHYKATDHEAKQAFIRSTLNSIRPARVLDVGANTGVYSRIAAGCGADVVAWDTDVQATEMNWRAARNAGLSILPLVADFARPTPAIGWNNKESSSLLDRARGQFDCVLMLGIVHHLLVADQIPLRAIVEQLWEISNRWAIVEWIPQNDSQFNELCRGREALYSHLNEEYFIQTLSIRFTIRSRDELLNGRSLWLVERIT
jgi:2-polyprenyl-3-methyl-5-hydroxy-6-metoxy-1,4-benzoquinol methylase